MTEPYGQQPNPGGGYPQQGTPPGGYPQAPGYGSMPHAPQEYAQGPIPRPSTVMAAAVLAYVQAGITAITTILAFIGVGNVEGGAMAEALLVAVAQTAGIVLLIVGGVQFAGGKSRMLLIVGCALELVICVYYLISFLVAPKDGVDEQLVDAATGVLVFSVLFFAAMPTISLIMSLGRSATQFLQSRRAR